MARLAKALSAAAGNAAGDPVYVEDVFSNYLYTGTGSTLAINNGIDLADKGGLVWIKARNNARSHALFDTERGANLLASNGSAAQYSSSGMSANSNGFTVVDNSVNKVNETIASWTFAKQKGFFDVVSWTGNGTGSRAISHGLNAKVGTIIVKCTSHTQNWAVYHSGVPTGNAYLNTSSAFASGSGNGLFGDSSYNNIAPTTSVFYVGTDNEVNGSGRTYVAYVFAEGTDAASQIFGDDGDEPIIKCGSYTGSGAVGKTITLGFEPQWMLIKNVSASTPWVMIDNMRGMPVNGEGPRLLADQSAAEVSGASFFAPRADGAEVTLQNTYVNTSGETYVYIAIRRGPMKEPSAGTDFFQPIGTSGDNPNTTTATFPWDMQFNTFTNTNYATYNNQINDRLRGFGFVGSWSSTPHLTTANTDVQTVSNSFLAFKSNGMDVDKSTGWGASATTIFYNFRRYPKVFDVVCYAGAGGNADVTHNLGVAPEMMIVKATDKSEGWAVQAYPALSLVSRVGILNSTNPFSGNSQFNGAPTATVFKVGTSGNTNESGYNYVAYLFATLPNVSKIGFYDGTAATINIDCGFSSPARFVMIKRADAGAGPDNWFVFDSVRGISVGNDPWFAMNTTDAQVTTNNYISPYASGFTVNATTASGINELYGDYIFLAIA